MRMKYCSRVLALLLAASLMAGDCIPAMATEQQVEIAEESESGDTVEDATGETEDAQEADESMDSEESSESAEVMGEETETENVGDENSGSAEESEDSADSADSEAAGDAQSVETEENVTGPETEEEEAEVQSAEDEVITQEESAEASIPEANATVTLSDGETKTITVPSGYSGYGDTLATLKFSESGAYEIEVDGMGWFYIWDKSTYEYPNLGTVITADYESVDGLFELVKGSSYAISGSLTADETTETGKVTEVTVTVRKVDLATPETFELGSSVEKADSAGGYYSIFGDQGDIYYLYITGDVDEIEENVEFINGNQSFSIISSLVSATTDGVIYSLAYYGSGSLEIFIPSGTGQMTVSASNDLQDLTKIETVSLEEWSGSQTVSANTTKICIFETGEMEDYYVSGTYSYDSDSASGLNIVFQNLNGSSVSTLYYYDETNQRTDYGFGAYSTEGWDVDTFRYALVMENNSSADITVDLYSYSDSGIEPVVVGLDDSDSFDATYSSNTAKYVTSVSGYKCRTQYYKFTAETTGIYNVYAHTTVASTGIDNTQFLQLTWLYREYEEDGENVRTAIVGTSDSTYNIPMKAGDSIVFRLSLTSSNTTYTVQKEDMEVTEGDELQFVSVMDDYGYYYASWYIFTPESSGTLKADSLLSGTYYYDRESNTRMYWDYSSQPKMDVEAGETYFFYSMDTATLSVTKLFTVTAEQESYTLTYNYDKNTYDPISTYVYLTVDSEKNVPLSEVEWSATYLSNDGSEATEVDDFDPENVVFSAPGTYTITAKYGSAQESLTIEVGAEESKETVALKSGIEKYIFKNVQKNVTKLSDITDELEAELLDESPVTGSFTYTNPSTGKTIATSTKLSSLPTTVKVTFTPEDTDTYAASSAEVKIVYANVTLKSLEVSATKLAADPDALVEAAADEEKTSSSGYPYTATISPIFSCGDQEYTAAELTNELVKINSEYYLVAGSSLDSEKVVITDMLYDGDPEEGTYAYVCDTVTGVGKGTAKVPYITNIGYYDETTNSYKNFYSKTSYVTFTVVNDTSMVKYMNVSLTENTTDDTQEVITDNEGKTLYLLNDADNARSYTVNLTAKDYNGGTIENASVKWSTTSSSIAKVTTASDGTVTLTIPKNASGTATVTVTAQDSQKVSASFTVTVADTDVRLVTTSLTMNSYSEDYGKIYMYPNTLLDSVVEGEVTVKVQPVVKTGSGKNVTYVSYENAGKTCALTFKDAVDGYVTLGEDGYIEVQYEEPTAANKTTSIILEITLTCDEYTFAPQYKTVKVTNKKSFPKTTVSVAQNYNSFWTTDADRNALLNVTTAGVLESISLDADTSKGYYINNPEESINDTQHTVELGWAATENVTKAGKATLALTISYDGYRATNTVKKTVSAVNTAPTFTVYGYDAWSPVFYTDLGETEVQVLIALPDQITSLSDITSLTSTSTAFTVTDSQYVENATYPNKKSESVALSKALLVTLESETNKTASVKFTIESDKLTKAVTSKALTITAKKASSVKTTLYNTVTGSTASSYTLQQLQAGAEALTLGTSYTLGSAKESYVVCTGANASTRTQIANGNLVLTQSSDEQSYTISASDTLFTKASSCKLSFTTYVMSENGDDEYHPLKTVTLTLTLQKQKKAATPTLSLKASGSLNVVDPTSSVKITPSFKNRTQGSTIRSIAFADSADAELYNLSYDDQTGVVTLTKKADTLTLGKDSVGLVYRLRKTNGEVVKLSAKVTVSVVQTGAIKTSASSVTLYNASKGETYGKTVTVSVSKPAGATIAEISDGTEVTGLTVTGLEGSTISYSCSLSEDGSAVDITFYMQDGAENVAKSYKAKLTVTFDGASKAYTKTITVKVVK